MIDDLSAVLDLEELEPNRFRGQSFDPGWQRIFGGQVLGQALMAASRTVPVDRLAHSLHAYFLRAGDPSIAVDYEVERLRDGGSFTTRRVVAVQHGEPTFVLSASFHIGETGYEHQIAAPAVPSPDEFDPASPTLIQLLADIPEPAQRYWQRLSPIELRPVDLAGFLKRDGSSFERAIWIRMREQGRDDPAFHRAALAYASDLTLLDTALLVHGRTVLEPGLQVASLDHALWFHRPFRIDDWLLYVETSPSTHGARGFVRGDIFDRVGTLVASVAQEGLIRNIGTGRRP